MKRYIALILTTAALITAAFFVPSWVMDSLTDVKLTGLSLSEYTETVNASGTVEYCEKKEISTDLPLVPAEVYVSVGDHVEVGDVIAAVGKEETCSAVLSILNITGGQLSSEVIAALGGQTDKLSSILELLPDTIVANASGTITDLALVKGAVTTPGAVLATISNSDQLQARVAVSEANVSRVKEGQQVTLSGSAFKGKKYTGTVSKIYPTARKQYVGTTQETVVDVLVSFDGADEGVKSGFTVKAAIQTSEKQQFGTLPYESIGQDEKGEYVFVYQAGKVFKRYVRTGKELPEAVEIQEGISAQDRVILNAEGLRHNSFVHVVE